MKFETIFRVLPLLLGGWSCVMAIGEWYDCALRAPAAQVIASILYGKELAMIVTTGNDVPGKNITEYLGVVRGIVVRSPSIGQGFVGGLKQLVGGNIEEYAQVCEHARAEA